MMSPSATPDFKPRSHGGCPLCPDNSMLSFYGSDIAIRSGLLTSLDHGPTKTHSSPPDSELWQRVEPDGQILSQPPQPKPRTLKLMQHRQGLVALVNSRKVGKGRAVLPVAQLPKLRLISSTATSLIVLCALALAAWPDGCCMVQGRSEFCSFAASCSPGS